MPGSEAILDSGILKGGCSSELEQRFPNNADITISDINEQLLEKAKQHIYSIDLTSVLERLVKADGWRHREAVKAIKQYRNYLFLRKKYPTEKLPPSYEVDEVWHAHILHTNEYRKFCNAVFPELKGSYLNHYPQLPGTSSTTDAEMDRYYEKTQQLYKQEFGDYLRQVKRNWFMAILERFVK